MESPRLIRMKISTWNYVIKLLRFSYQASLVLALSMGVSTAHAKKYKAQEEFTIGGLKIAMVRSEMNFSGVTYFEKDGLEITVSVPHITKAMVTHYGSNQYLDDVDEVESGIGVAVIAEDKLWFGMSFYGGESMDGMGGIGFFDPRLQKIGILRHPALVNCSVKEIQVTPSEIIALTYSQGELSEGICNGLVSINRKNLASTIQLPKGKIQTLWDKDDELSDEEKLVGKQYETATSNLAAHFSKWPKKAGPIFTSSGLKALDSMGLEKFMLRQAEIEYRWFDQAVKHGSITFEQSCKMAASEVSRCSPPYKDCPPPRLGWLGAVTCTSPLTERKDCDGDVVCASFVDMVMVIFFQDQENYSCSSHGWLSIPLLSDKGKSGYSSRWPTAQFFAPGRLYNPFDLGVVKNPISIVNAGYESVFFSSGKKNSFFIESIKTVNATCGTPFEALSGPVIKSISARLTTTEVNQTYVPSEIDVSVGMGKP